MLFAKLHPGTRRIGKAKSRAIQDGVCMMFLSGAAMLPVQAQTTLPGFGPAGGQVAGRFVGIATCGARVDQFALELTFDEQGALQGVITYKPWLQAPLGVSAVMLPRGQALAAGGQAVRLRGGYYPALSSLELQSVPGDPSVTLTGFVTGGGRGLIANPPQPGMSLCTVHLATRGTELPADWMGIAKELGGALGASGGFRNPFASASRKFEEAKDAVRRSCEANTFGWLAQVTKQGVPSADMTRAPLLPNLFSDASFVPHFGKPFTEMSESERAQLDVALQGSCTRDQRLSVQAASLLAMVRGVFREPSDFSHVQKAASRQVYERLRQLMADSVARLPALVEQGAAPRQPAEMVDRLRPWFPLLWPSEAQGVEQAFKGAQTPLAMALLRRALQEAQGSTAPDLDALERLAALLPARYAEFPYLTGKDWASLQDPVIATLNKDTPEVARRWASSERTPEHVRRLGPGLTPYPQLLKSLSPAAREASDQAINVQRAQTLTFLASAEQKNFRAATQPGSGGMKGLEALMSEHRRLTQAYAELLQDDAFKALERERDAAHSRAVADLAPDLLAAIEKSSSAQELERLRVLTLRDGASDGAAAQRVQAALGARLALVSTRDREAGQQARLQQERLQLEAARAENDRLSAPYRERGLVYRPPSYWTGYHHGKELQAIFDGDFQGAAQTPVFADIYRRFQEAYSVGCEQLLPADTVVYTEISTIKYRGEPERSYPTGFKLRVRREYDPGYKAMGEVMASWASSMSRIVFSSGQRQLRDMFRDIEAVTAFSMGTRNDITRFFRENACDSGQLQQFSENLLRMVQLRPTLQQSAERGYPYARNEK